MEINDIVYDYNVIEDELVLDLIKSEQFQRLKGICQQGVPKGYMAQDQPDYSRYEHSIGVMLALKRLNAPIEEQVAGLLHDVSHTAFSHLVDYVFGTGVKEAYQDSIHSRFFEDGSELSDILKKHSIDPKRISNPELYPLLEREQPEMCADRLDSTLRYFAHTGKSDFVASILSSVKKSGNTIIFDSFNTAREFALRHIKVWNGVLGGYGERDYEMRIRWYILGSTLTYAIKQGIIKKEDFDYSDSYVMEKLEASNNKKILEMLEVLKGALEFEISDHAPKVTLFSKFRYVDPIYSNEKGERRVSDTDPSFRELVKDAMKRNQAGINVARINGLELPL